MEKRATTPAASMASLLATVGGLAEEIETATSGLDAVEGQRFLLRMLGASVDTFVERDDVDRPAFAHAESVTRKMFADNPDTDYLHAPIDLTSGRVYRLWGRIPRSALYVGILLYGKGGRIGNRLTDRELQLDDEGRFEVLIATAEQSGGEWVGGAGSRARVEGGGRSKPGVWLRGDGDETAVMVRQYFSNRADQEPLQVDIELVGDLPPHRQLDAASLAERLGKSERMLKAVFKRTRQAYQMASMAPVNQFVTIPEDQFFPTPDNRYTIARYHLAEGERAVVRGRLPRARYFSLALYNAWLESFDYRHHQVSLNHEQIELQADGSFEVLLGESAPGLDTAGHSEGYIIARALLLEGEMPELAIEIVPA